MADSNKYTTVDNRIRYNVFCNVFRFKNQTDMNECRNLSVLRRASVIHNIFKRLNNNQYITVDNRERYNGFCNVFRLKIRQI